jgi:hypothetical protein
MQYLLSPLLPSNQALSELMSHHIKPLLFSLSGTTPFLPLSLINAPVAFLWVLSLVVSMQNPFINTAGTHKYWNILSLYLGNDIRSALQHPLAQAMVQVDATTIIFVHTRHRQHCLFQQYRYPVYIKQFDQ